MDRRKAGTGQGRYAATELFTGPAHFLPAVAPFCSGGSVAL